MGTRVEAVASSWVMVWPQPTNKQSCQASCADQCTGVLARSRWYKFNSSNHNWRFLTDHSVLCRPCLPKVAVFGTCTGMGLIAANILGNKDDLLACEPRIQYVRGLHSLQNSISVVCELKQKQNSNKRNSISVHFC